MDNYNSEYNELFSNNPVVQKFILNKIIKNGKLDDILVLERLIKEKISNDVYFLARKAIEIIKKRNNISPPDIYHIADINNQQKVNILLFNKDFWKRIKVIQAITIYKKSEFLSGMKEVLRHEKNPYVIATLVKSIGILGKEDELKTIEGYLENEDARIRANTLEAMERMNTTKVYSLALPLLNDSHHRVRMNAANILFEYHNDKIVDLLVDMINYGKPSDLEAGLFFLSTHIIDDERLINALIDRQKRIKVLSIKQKISELLKKITMKKAKGISFKEIVKSPPLNEVAILNEKIKQKKIKEIDIKDIKRFENIMKTGSFYDKRKAILDIIKLPREIYHNVLKEFRSQEKHKVVVYFINKALEEIDKLKK